MRRALDLLVDRRVSGTQCAEFRHETFHRAGKAKSAANGNQQHRGPDRPIHETTGLDLAKTDRVNDAANPVLGYR